MIYLMIIEIQEEKFNRETKILHIVIFFYNLENIYILL